MKTSPPDSRSSSTTSRGGRKISLSPITRSSGPLSIQVVVNQGRVVNAQVIGGLFRGYELIMVGRDPFDATYLTEKICGICSTAHAMVSSLMLEELYFTEVPPNGWIIRNLMLGAEFLQNHLRHFYFLELPDYLQGPSRFPFINPGGRDYRFSPKVNERLLNHYHEAFKASLLAHELLALFGAKVPHAHGLVPGGATVEPRADLINKFGAVLAQIRHFIDTCLLPDTELLAETYADYFQIGQGPSNFLSYGGFPRGKKEYQIPAGVILGGEQQPLDLDKITESVEYSWFRKQPAKRVTDLEAVKQPESNKPGAYTWVIAPRYAGQVVEVGPLARAIMRGEFHSSSTMDRIVARSREAALIAQWMAQWLSEIEEGKPAYRPPADRIKTQAFGTLEVPRGGLLHGSQLDTDKIAHYAIITPSGWNFSPRDNLGNLGALEHALIGIPIDDPNTPIEVGRVARSFDPCLYCATHVLQV